MVLQMRGKGRLHQANKHRTEHSSATGPPARSKDRNSKSSTPARAQKRESAEPSWVVDMQAALRDLQHACSKYEIAYGAGHVVHVKMQPWIRICEMAITAVK